MGGTNNHGPKSHWRTTLYTSLVIHHGTYTGVRDNDRPAGGADADEVDSVWHHSHEMERICCFHPALWPVVMELTDGKVRKKIS